MSAPLPDQDQILPLSNHDQEGGHNDWAYGPYWHDHPKVPFLSKLHNTTPDSKALVKAMAAAPFRRMNNKQTPVQVFNDGVFIRVKEYSSIITYNCRKLLSKSHLCNAPIEVMECGCDNDNLATFWIKQSYGWRCRHGHHFMDKCGRAYFFKSNSWEGRKFIFEDGEFYWNIDDWRTLVSR